MSLPTPNYVTIEAVKIHVGGSKSFILDAGCFVRPIDPSYLPAHIKETIDFRWLDSSINVYIYCHYGIALISRSLIRRT